MGPSILRVDALHTRDDSSGFDEDVAIANTTEPGMFCKYARRIIEATTAANACLLQAQNAIALPVVETKVRQ